MQKLPSVLFESKKHDQQKNDDQSIKKDIQQTDKD